MRADSSVTALTGALVHRSVCDVPHQRWRHATFIAHKLAVSFAALAFAPFYLVFQGPPNLVGAAVSALALMPLAAAMVAARTGRIVLAHAVAFGGLLVFAMALSFGTTAGPAAAFAWLIVAQVEAALALDKRLSQGAGLLVGLGAIAAVAAGISKWPVLPTMSAVMAGLALVYAIGLAPLVSGLIRAARGHHLRQSARQRAISAALGDLVIGFDADGSVGRVSAGCETLLGVSAADLMGRGLFEQVHVADRPAFLKLVADCAHGHDTVRSHIRVRGGSHGMNPAGYAEPRYLWIEIAGRRLELDETARTEVVAVLRDETATRDHDIEVEAAQQSIDAAIRSKDQFLANMSHELRTPLNAIIGFSEMLGSRTLRPHDADKQREYAHIINQSGQHLLSVVNSILDMSKIQSGTFSILPEPFEIAPLVEQCCDMMRLKAQEGRVRLVHDCGTAIDPVVGDRRACKQILINLLSNAVKFTPAQGEVRIAARPDGNALLVTVSDTGIGIGATDLLRLGDPFFQAGSSLSRPFEGTGLGLSVVRGLIGLHGGTIAIESEPGKGTCVSVRLPLDCRTIGGRAPSANIEAIPRRTAPPRMVDAPEPRMKEIA